eukprot:scaffold20768_cov118-Isochrysis_galbana.AAC.1
MCVKRVIPHTVSYISYLPPTPSAPTVPLTPHSHCNHKKNASLTAPPLSLPLSSTATATRRHRPLPLSARPPSRAHPCFRSLGHDLASLLPLRPRAPDSPAPSLHLHSPPLPV